MEISNKLFQSIIKQEFSEMKAGFHEESRVAVGEIEGIQFQLLLTNNSDEFIKMNPRLECIK